MEAVTFQRLVEQLDGLTADQREMLAVALAGDSDAARTTALNSAEY